MLNFGEDLADIHYSAFFEQFRKIAEQPYLYQVVDDIRKGYRRCVPGVDSIYYRIIDDSVEIVRIIGRQNFQL